MSVSVHLSLFRDLLLELNSGHHHHHHLSSTNVNTIMLYFGSIDGRWQWGYLKDLGMNSSAINETIKE